MHHGTVSELHDLRAEFLHAAHAAHPERFVNKPPTPPMLPVAAWINKPTEITEVAQ